MKPSEKSYEERISIVAYANVQLKSALMVSGKHHVTMQHCPILVRDMLVLFAYGYDE